MTRQLSIYCLYNKLDRCYNAKRRKEDEDMKTDVLIVGCGCSGLYAALQLDEDLDITILTKSKAEDSDSFLAQGGICVLKDESDYQAYFEDTLKAGHYENDKQSVDIMIRSSQNVIQDLISYGVDFHKDENGKLDYTREGAHSQKRILFHEDETGKEITKHLLAKVRQLKNVKLLEYTTLVDLIEKDNTCYGGVIRKADGSIDMIQAKYTMLATGGIGGVYRHSTNYRHLTGDGIALAVQHKIALKNVNYVQIHPTTFYSPDEKDRSFLISESVRGEGALLLDKNMHRFVNELLPRDVVTKAIYAQMKKDHTTHVWEDLRPIGHEELVKHFPHIVEHCHKMGYDPEKEPIPVVPAQHYFMGGIDVNKESKTSMEHLYAIGETACNGVHGKNRLASNSLLESLVFAKRAAKDLMDSDWKAQDFIAIEKPDVSKYADSKSLSQQYRQLVQTEIKKADSKKENENV